MIEFQAYNWSNGIPIVEVMFVILFVKVFCNMVNSLDESPFKPAKSTLESHLRP